jgi:SAM-dependent methyltransferase
MAMTRASDDFLERQQAHFADADAEHFAWQTRGPGFAEREASLLAATLGAPTIPVLEVGCGEGGNLFHLLRSPTDGQADAGYVGIDAFSRKLRFASRNVSDARYVCAASECLPFRAGSFATVLIRDVLHHLPDPRRAVAEACRVLRPGGRFVLIEPNARNPLIRLQMLLIPAERGAARSDAAWIRTLLDGLPLDALDVSMRRPLPLELVLLHHRFGMPSLGRRAMVNRAIRLAEAASGRLLPESRWSTIVARARRRG